MKTFTIWLESHQNDFQFYLMQLADALEERDYLNMGGVLDRVVGKFYDVLREVESKLKQVSKKDLSDQLSQLKDPVTVKRIYDSINGFTRDEKIANGELRAICHFFCMAKNGMYYLIAPRRAPTYTGSLFYDSLPRYENDIREMELKIAGEDV